MDVSFAQTPLREVFDFIEAQTGYTINYFRDQVDPAVKVSLKMQQATIREVLNAALAKTNYNYQIQGSTVIISTKPAVAAKENGKITGRLLDDKNGDPIIGATIRIGATGTVTDINGQYELVIAPGVYTLEISSIGYTSKKVTDVSVEAKEPSVLNLTITPQKGTLRGVEVVASARRESIAALYAAQKNNAAITDGISAEQISRIPDKNMGEVLKRVSGLSTMDNKYVVVRGLSERYNQAILNGQVMPSTELNRKNFSFDLIPSNIVENVVVIKTLTPDRSAEFGGGLVEVNTLDIPVNDFLSINVGGSHNSKTTNKNFRSLKLEGSEYAGKVADHRNLLGSLDWKNTADVIAKYEAANKQTTMFSNNWGVYEMKAPLNQNYQLAGGKVINLSGNNKLGFTAAASYRNTFQTQDVRMSRGGFTGQIDPSEPESVGFSGQRYGFTTNLGGMAGVGYRGQRHRVSYQALYLRTLDQQLVVGTGINENNLLRLGYYDLTTQTDLWQHLLKGEHSLGRKGVKFKWSGSYTRLDRQKPDNHQLVADIMDQNGHLETNEFNISSPQSDVVSAGAARWWSRAFENTFNWDAAVSIPFTLNANGRMPLSSIFKTGYGGWNKDRLFYVLNTGSALYNTTDYPPLAQAFSEARKGEIYMGRFADDFKKSASLHAGYLMMDNRLGDKWRLVWGVRAEYYNLNDVNVVLDSLFSEINESRGGNNQLDYSAILNREPNWNFFPSANLTYSLTKASNLRLAYAKSIIRPDLRELSFFREYDFELGGAYESGLINSTIMHHLDFRYEWYPAAGEIISLSLFYKKTKDPMEIIEKQPRLFTLKNNKSAENYGLEIEARKKLDFIKVPVIRNITLYGNFTILDAWVTPVIRQDNRLDPNDPSKVKPEETVGKKERRPQTGASNYMVNAGVYYDSKWLSLGLTYNNVSNRMFRTAEAYSQSIFERPLESLDAQIAFTFLKDKATLRLNAANLLNSFSLMYQNRYDDPEINDLTKQPSVKELLYQPGKDLIDYEARPGVTLSASLSYRF